MKNLIILALSLSAFFLHFTAQAQQGEDPMKKLSVFVGQWEGRATQSDQTGTHNIRQTEDVKYMLGGDILVIKGTGYDASTDSLAFEAFGIIHWNANAAEYKFNAYSMGQQVVANAEFKDNDFVWWFETPNGTVRYTLKFTENTWTEDGAFSQDGDQWYPFFHMELKRIKNGE